MDFFTFRFSAHGLLLVFCLCSFWSTTDCNPVKPKTTATTTTTTATTATTATATTATTATTTATTATATTTTTTANAAAAAATATTAVTYQSTTALSSLGNVNNVTVVHPTENSVTITFDKINETNDYNLTYSINETFTSENITWLNNNPVEYTVNDLMPAQTYNMTLYSQQGTLHSSGYSFNATTAPENVANFRADTQNESSITLTWTKKSGDLLYILNFKGEEKNVTENREVVANLKSSTEYSFTLYSVFEGIRSTGANLTTSTAPSKVNGFNAVSRNETSITLEWENDPKINYTLRFNEEEKNITGLELGSIMKYPVTGLQDTTIYNFTLFTVFQNILGDGMSISAATCPRDAIGFQVQNRTNSSITLVWDKVGDSQDYEIEYETNRMSVGNVGTYIAKNLQSGTLYIFRLYTKFANLSSRGIRLEAPTVPSPVSSVEIVERTLNTITLKWERVKENWTYLVDFNSITTILNSSDRNSVYYTVKSLKAGTLYSFNIETVFMEIKSTSVQFQTVTVIDCSIVDWEIKETSIVGLVEGEFTNATASNGSLHVNSGSNKQIQFTGLYPGANYSMMLMYKNLTQCSYIFNTIPPGLTAKCKNWNAGYSIYIEWDKPSGVWDSVEINVSNNVHKKIENTKFFAEIANFQPAKKYQVHISSLSGLQRSSPYLFTCATDARGVIAGAFFGVFIFIVLVCVVAFIMLRRPDIISSHKKSSPGRAKMIVKKCVPLEKFPGHFKELSADENKGFSLDYEELASVGTEQTQNAATTPENKPKNRFINVLPYDQSRVKLTSSPQGDYINANYMPGYNSDREFIATQGPLPSTVNDFWRMIWEQKVRGVVMVTNCTEGGRVKCEQYWPDSNPRQCGDLEVFTTSEKQQPDWTLREFTVKHSRTSEERTVRHFHFTAWPDHGVPQGTQVLIEFRELVRRHMQREVAGTPTVVHCSAGVGRTGTIIALDVLLQQMEKEKTVDIYGFVQKMRLNRPHMVQTESQYVFLHQCILDSLMQNENHDENIYENELIYANATALREFQNNMNRS